MLIGNYSTRGMLETTEVNYSTGGMLETTLDGYYSINAPSDGVITNEIGFQHPSSRVINI